MEHPDWPALLAAVAADPDDDTTRLVAADFLDENGDPDRAAFIRVQVELARAGAAGEGKGLAAGHLRAKERAFLGPLSVYRTLWAAEACPELVKVSFRDRNGSPLDDMEVSGADQLTWRRGFVEGVRCPAGVWLGQGAAVRLRNPIREVLLTGCDPTPRDHWYAGLPALTGLRRLRLADAADGLREWLAGWLPGTEVRAAG